MTTGGFARSAGRASGRRHLPSERDLWTRTAAYGPIFRGNGSRFTGYPVKPPPRGTRQLLGFSDPTTHIAKNCEPPP